MLRTPPATDMFTAAYDLLARVYLGGPRAARRDELPAFDTFVKTLGSADPDWPESVESLIARADADIDGAQSAFLERLALPVPGRYVPPYGSVYLDGGTLWGPSTMEVLRLYEAERLDWDQERRGAGGTRITAPDHVGVEMAFLAVVSARSTSGRADAARHQRLRSFLDHTTTWLPMFSDALGIAGRVDLIGGWTSWATAVVAADIRRRSDDESAS